MWAGYPVPKWCRALVPCGLLESSSRWERIVGILAHPLLIVVCRGCPKDSSRQIRCKWNFWNSVSEGCRAVMGCRLLQVGFQCAASLRVKYRCCVLRHLNQCHSLHSLHSHVLLVAHQFPQISLLCCYQTRTGEDLCCYFPYLCLKSHKIKMAAANFVSNQTRYTSDNEMNVKWGEGLA